jgi:hypothetical protein
MIPASKGYKRGSDDQRATAYTAGDQFFASNQVLNRANAQAEPSRGLALRNEELWNFDLFAHARMLPHRHAAFPWLVQTFLRITKLGFGARVS